MTEFSWIPDAAHKDAHPLDTVKRIKQILKEHGIVTEENWCESDVPHCYSLRVSVAGSVFGTNGKGVTREFALASGYGELMERLQLGHVWRDKLNPEGGVASCEAQSEPVSGDALLARNGKWYDAFSKELLDATGVSMTGKELLAQFCDAAGNIQATPFYCLTGHTWEHLPTAMCKSLYVTNGGAAGNTVEEALVQAISEIVERSYKIRYLAADIPAPEVPEEVLRSCPIAYEIICYLRENGYTVTVKDCSMGEGFPVICICLVNKRTGRYHSHFGAYPNFEIALERTLTESFQGRNIRGIAKHEDFCYLPDSKFDLEHLSKELVYGTSEKPPRFFCRPAGQQYSHNPGFSGKTNRELLAQCVEFFRKQNLDILVRDCSCLGFPTYQVIVPGYSEVFPHRLSAKHNDSRCTGYAIRTLRNPATADMEQIMGLLMHNKIRSKAGVNTFSYEAGIPAKLTGKEESLLMFAALAHISYTLRRKKDTVTYIDRMIGLGDLEETEYLLCLKRYLTMQGRYEEEELFEILGCFHSRKSIEQLRRCIREKQNPLDPVTLHCDLQCGAACPLVDRCCKKQTDKIIGLISRKSKEIDQTVMQRQLLGL